MNGQINKGVTLDSYEKLEGFINDISKRHCAKCKKRTYHIDVKDIRSSCLFQKELSIKYNVNQSTISRIKNNKRRIL